MRGVLHPIIFKSMFYHWFLSWPKRLLQCCFVLLLANVLWLGLTPQAIAGLTDDRFDGNIFALYAGNGSLVPPNTTLAASLKREKPAILFFYLDDSSDCKQFSTQVSQTQAYYGRVASLIPISVDALPLNAGDALPTEPRYYYRGYVPQTVILDQSGQVVLDEIGDTAFEVIDDKLREVFDLLPRSESVPLKRRMVNEISVELAPE